MSDLSITAAGVGVGVTAGTAFGLTSKLGRMPMPLTSGSFGALGGIALGGIAAHAADRWAGEDAALDPKVALPAVAGAALAGAKAYSLTRSVSPASHAIVAAVGPALLVGAGVMAAAAYVTRNEG